jgi:hypothetical protein
VAETAAPGHAGEFRDCTWLMMRRIVFTASIQNQGIAHNTPHQLAILLSIGGLTPEDGVS